MRSNNKILTFLLFVSLSISSVSSIADDKISQQAKDLVTMINAMVGTWVGDVEYYDRNTGTMKRATAEHVISTTPIPTSFSIYAKFFRKDGGDPLIRYEVMGVRGDGAVIRMIDYREYDSHLKNEVVLDYSMEDENNWSMTFLEDLEGNGENQAGPVLRRVQLVFSGDSFTIKKTTLTPSDRPFDIFAKVKRK